MFLPPHLGWLILGYPLTLLLGSISPSFVAEQAIWALPSSLGVLFATSLLLCLVWSTAWAGLFVVLLTFERDGAKPKGLLSPFFLLGNQALRQQALGLRFQAFFHRPLLLPPSNLSALLHPANYRLPTTCLRYT